MIHLEDLQVPGLCVSQKMYIKHEQQRKRKKKMLYVPKKIRYNLPSVSTQWNHNRMHLNPLAVNQDNIYKILLNRETHLRLNAKGFLMEADHDQDFTDIIIFCICKRRAGFHFKQHRSFNQCRHNEAPQKLVVEILLKSKFTDASQG